MANLLNDRNELLYSASSRVTGASVAISSGVANSLIVPKGATVTTPSALTLQANTLGYIAPSFTWSYRFGDTGNFTAITGTTNIINFACDAAFLTAAGTSTAVQFKVVVAETTANLGINQAEYTLSLPILREGTSGINGLNSITLILYKRTTTNAAPAFTAQDLAANSTYTFSTGQVVGQPTGWAQTIPSGTGYPYLWTTQVLAVSTTGSYAFNNSLWSSAVLYSQDGASGTNTALIYAYKRAVTAPTDNPGTVDYSFSTNAITTATLANSWSKTIPSGTDPLYVTVATAASITATDNVLAAEWTTPTQLVKNGTDGTNGINTAILYLYARNSNSTTAPTLDTTGTATYTFTTGAISGTLPAGWTATIPAESGGTVIWVVQATAASNTTTDTVANTEWSTPRVLSLQGTNGTPGTRGSRSIYSSNSAYTRTYTIATNAAGAVSYAIAATTLIAAAVSGSVPTTPIKGDSVTFSNPTTGSEYVYTITHDGTNWVTPGTVIDGSLLVTNSVTAAKINSNGLTIRDSVGNVILSAGVPGDVTNPQVNLDFSKVGGTTKPSDNANNTYVDTSGNIQGVSSGGGTGVANSLVTTLNLMTTNATQSGNTLKKVSSATGWDSQGYSLESYVGGAFCSFRADATTGYVMAGLNTDPVTNANYDTIDYAIYLNSGGSLLIYENGAGIGTFGTYAVGDIMSVTYDGSNIKYYKNGGVLRTVPVTITTALYFDSSMYLTGNSISQIKFGPMSSNAWSAITGQPAGIYNTNITITGGNINGIGAGAGTAVANSLIETLSVSSTGGMTVAGNTFTKTSGTADWNAQVFSTDSYVGGAYVRFSPLQTTASLMVGLNTDPTADASYSSIDYCIYLAGSEVYVYESGSGYSMSTSYTVNDVFAVTYDGSNIKYYKNGIVLRTVQVSITSPLYLDSSFVNGGINKVSFGPMSSNAWSAITGQPAGIYNSNISVSNGTINGIGAGAGTVVDNTYVRSNHNLIPNSDQNQTICFVRGWTPNGTAFDTDVNYASNYWGVDSYALGGNSTRNVIFHQSNNNGSGSQGVATDFYPNGGWGLAYAISVVAGQKYIFSAYIQGHRCGASVGLAFFDSNNNLISEVNSGYADLPYSGAARLEQYSRRYIANTAPANAAGATMYVRKHNTWDGYTESFIWLAAPQLETVNANVSTPGPYVPGPPSNSVSIGGLSALSASTLAATVSVNAVTGAGFRAGDLTWDSAGNRTGGRGAAMTPGGLVGHDGTKPTFAINSTSGAATFAGTLQAASGSFAGDISAASGNFSGSLSGANITGATGTFTGTLSAGTVDLSKLLGATYRYTEPGWYTAYVPSDFTQMRVTIVGAGGGGGLNANGAGGGGGGGLVVATFGVYPGQPITIQVGGGGAGGYPPYGPGGGGQDTTVIGYVAAQGGGGGGVYWNQAGSGGYGTIYGSNGTPGGQAEDNFVYGGNGGNSASNYGIGGVVFQPYSPGPSGGRYGGGGGGGTTGRGGDGPSGLAIIEFFNPNGVIIRSEWNWLISTLQSRGLI